MQKLNPIGKTKSYMLNTYILHKDKDNEYELTLYNYEYVIQYWP